VPRFFHDIFLYNDPEGFGVWRAEHQYEHTQFYTTLAAQTPRKLIPDLDLVSWDDSKPFQTRWLVAHESVHEQLRTYTGVSGVNLADVDLTKEIEFYEWLDIHRTEHTLLRQAFGIT
jgi:hypothetical protein